MTPDVVDCVSHVWNACKPLSCLLLFFFPINPAFQESLVYAQIQI